jgi:cyclopropane-fatty-acyl-phospholipid synthase
MAYTCAVFSDPAQDVTSAQYEKYDLVCRKLRLDETSRLLDIGCGWGAFAIHAVERTGCRAVAVTLGTRQVEYARELARERGLERRVEFRQLDYRDVTDGPFDAVVAMGAFEHIGLARRGPTLFDHVSELLAPGGRFLNQAITSQAMGRMVAKPRGFIQRYVFPDGELNELGRTISAMQAAGLEVRHVENLREHYVLTSDKWRAHLEDDWAQAVATGGEERARIWRLYLAGYRWQLAHGKIGVCQSLAVRPHDGESGVGLREDYLRDPVELVSHSR